MIKAPAVKNDYMKFASGKMLAQTILLQLAVHMEPVEEASGKKLLNSCTFHTMILSYWRKRPKAVD